MVLQFVVFVVLGADVAFVPFILHNRPAQLKRVLPIIAPCLILRTCDAERFGVSHLGGMLPTWPQRLTNGWYT